MPIQLNPSKVPIWKSESILQLGLGTDAQQLGNLSIEQEQLIQMLFKPVPENQLERLGETVGLTALDTRELVERLKPSLVQNLHSHEDRTMDLRFAELMRIAFDTDRLAENVIGKRSSSLIEIRSLDRTGLLLVKALAETGFQNFQIGDYESVNRNDCGELGYPTTFLGHSRLSAAREILTQSSGATRLTQETKKQTPRLTILTASHTLTPNSYRDNQNPYLAIEYGIDKIQISSVVTPGQTACLGCRDRWRSEVDPNWGTTSIQLTQRHDQLDDAAALLTAVALATKSVCQFIDLGVGLVTGFEVNLKSREFRESNFQRHPNCDCRLIQPQ